MVRYCARLLSYTGVCFLFVLSIHTICLFIPQSSYLFISQRVPALIRPAIYLSFTYFFLDNKTVHPSNILVIFFKRSLVSQSIPPLNSQNIQSSVHPSIHPSGLVCLSISCLKLFYLPISQIFRQFIHKFIYSQLTHPSFKQ